MARRKRRQMRSTSKHTAAPADRRYRSSEKERRRRVRNRKRRHNFFLFLCVILICTASIGATTIFFRVSDVTIEAETRYDTQELITASGIRTGDNMAFLRTGRIADRLEETYPYLRDVQLHRKLPSSVTITFHERTPLLSVSNGGKYLLIDEDGRVLEQVDTPAAETICVSGVKTDQLTVGGYLTKDKQKNLYRVLELVKKLPDYALNKSIVSVEVKSSDDFCMQYEDRYTILLGNMKGLDHKLQFLQAILKEPTLPYNGTIDLTAEKEARYRPTEVDITEKQAEFETPEERAAAEAARKAAEEAAAAAEEEAAKQEENDEASSEKEEGDTSEQDTEQESESDTESDSEGENEEQQTSEGDEEASEN